MRRSKLEHVLFGSSSVRCRRRKRKRKGSTRMMTKTRMMMMTCTTRPSILTMTAKSIPSSGPPKESSRKLTRRVTHK